MKFLFVHLDMVFGGAERLILDVAETLVLKGHEVTLFSSFYKDKSQLQNTYPQINFQVKSLRLPSSLSGYFQALLNYIRFTVLCLYVLSRERSQDVYVFDQIAFPIFLFRLFGKKTIFYCHFPDALQTRNYNKGILNRFYRWILSLLEKFGMCFANLILCNSKFTLSKTAQFFNIKEIKLEVLYPMAHAKSVPQNSELKRENKFLLSLNRFEENKRQDFILKTVQPLLEKDTNLKLFFVGGLNQRNYQDHAFFQSILKEVKKSKLEKRVQFFVDVSEKTKEEFIRGCEMVLYPPENEHFGIIPLEAVVQGKLVIAHQSGGPKETLTEQCLVEDFSEEKWRKKIESFLKMEQKKKEEIAQKNFQLYQENFSESVFQNKVQEFFVDNFN